jgi:acyl-CoA thioesterase FadM
MNLYLRLLLTALRALFESRLSTRTSCWQWFRVWPTDIDAFGHMNNGRYLQIMDVARLRWLVRTGTIRTMRRQKWTVALGGGLIRYRRPLRFWARYRVSTRLICWDDLWFYLEHAFYDRQQRRVAVGLSRAAFRGKGAWVDTDTVMDAVENGIPSPPMPAYLQTWLTAENAMFDAATDLPDAR